MTRERVEFDSSAPRKTAVDLSWPAIFRQYAMFALLGLGIVGGALYFVYQRVDDEIRSRLERSLQDHYGPRGFQVRVRDVVWQEGVGFEIHDLAILDPQSRPMELLHVEEVRIPCDRRLQDLLTEEWSPTQIVLKRPKLALVATAGQRPRALDLFPLPPMSPGGAFPSVTVESGEIAWIDPRNPTSRLFETRSIFGTLTPLTPSAGPVRSSAVPADASAPAPTGFDVRLVARADRMERVELNGLISQDLADWSVAVDLRRLRVTPEWLDLVRASGFDVPFAPPKFRGEATIRLTANEKQSRVAPSEAAASPQEASPPTFEGAEANMTPIDVAAARANRLPAFGQAASMKDSWLAALPCQLSISGAFVDLEVDDPRLLHPIRDAQGSFVVDDTGISVTSASGRWGAGTIWLQGEVVDPVADPRLTGRVKLREVTLDAGLAERLPAPAAKAYAQYSPVGRIHADLDLAWARGDWSGEAVIQAAGVTITPRDFPYPIEATVGTLRWKPRSLDVQLVGKAAGQDVRIEGSLADPLQEGPGRVAIRTERPVPIDERLLTAAASANPQAAAFLNQLQLQGTVAAEGALVRERAGEPARLQLTLTLADGSFRHRDVPYPLDDVQGTFRLEERRWSFERVAGRYGTALVIAEGSVQTDPALGRRMILKAVGTDVPIDESFLQSLQGPARTTCREMQLRGTLDQASIEWSYDFDSKQSDFSLRAWKWRLPPERVAGGEISLQPGCFPYLFDNVTGELLYQDGRLSLTKLRGKHGEETWTGDVTWERLQDGGWTFSLANLGVDRLQIHDQLRQALPADASRFFVDREVQGTFAVRGGLRVTRPTQRDAIVTDWNVAVDVERGSFGSTFPLKHLHGEVQLAGRMDPQGFRSRGELRVDSAMFRDYQITSLSGPVAVDSKQVLIGAWAEPRLVDRSPRSLTGTLFGGKVECDCRIELDRTGSFTVHTRLNGGDLTSLAQNAASGYQEISGKIDALLNLTGSGEGMHTLRGDGFVQLNDARIYEAPLVTTLLKSLPGKSPETPLFQTTDIGFRVQGSHVYLDRCNFHGDAITLKGQGEIGFDRSISLDFYAVAGKDKLQIPVITPALGIASRQILQIHVAGTLDSPVVENKPLPVLKETLDQVFPEAKAEPEVARLPSPLKWLQEATRY
ncbi:MAG TPA: hypothetical protein VGN57_21885 [Pirellulaceae bacterium]|nr:hypothetical protein [Pirellulaceae bacterium]